MEKIRLKNGQEFDLIGISENEKIRSFTISSTLPSGEVEAAFTDVSIIQRINDISQTTYYSGVETIRITHDMVNQRYTIDVSIDKTALMQKSYEQKLLEQSKKIDEQSESIVLNQTISDNSVAELTILIAGLYAALMPTEE